MFSIQTWSDYKAAIRKRLSQKRQHAGGTGGGPPLEACNLNELQARVSVALNMEKALIGVAGKTCGFAEDTNKVNLYKYTYKQIIFYILYILQENSPTLHADEHEDDIEDINNDVEIVTPAKKSKPNPPTQKTPQKKKSLPTVVASVTDIVLAENERAAIFREKMLAILEEVNTNIVKQNILLDKIAKNTEPKDEIHYLSPVEEEISFNEVGSTCEMSD